jgi:glycosyltransferase involved in cell wall biosynthesis
MKIEIVGKFYDNHSLAIVNRYIALELCKHHSVFITPIDMYDPETSTLDKQTVRQLKELEVKDEVEPEVQLRHTYPPIWRWPVSNKTKVVFIQPWEYNKIPLEWQFKWETFADALIVPSTWIRDRVLDAGLEPNRLFVVPNGYNEKLFNLEKVALSKHVDSGKLTFTYVGNSQYRKGIDLLLNAWSRAFQKADNVQLIIKDSPNIYGENNLLNDILRVQYKSGCGSIIYNSDNLTEEEMASIYKATDIIVHPYRGEGFGMHIQEAMACGAVPLVTHGGGPNDFVNNQNAMFLATAQKYVDITSPQVFAGKPGDSFTGMGGHAWIFEPDANDLMQKMQYLYYHHDRENVIRKLKENVTLINKWETVGALYASVLTTIQQNGMIPVREMFKQNFSINSQELENEVIRIIQVNTKDTLLK